VIVTERLRLRRQRLEDFPAALELWTDPVVTRYIGGRPSTEEEVWARLLRNVGHWELIGFGYWIVEDRDGGLVGEVGFADHRRDLVPSLVGLPELGWVLVPRAHGRGYATEAARAALDWADASLGAERTACIIHPENAQSRRVAAKCGYVEVARTTYKGDPTIVYMRPRNVLG
jgi:RimJ/RimL family protein N-acetyltransferase